MEKRELKKVLIVKGVSIVVEAGKLLRKDSLDYKIFIFISPFRFSTKAFCRETCNEGVSLFEYYSLKEEIYLGFKHSLRLLELRGK